MLIKGTRVPGVFSGDPERDPTARHLPRVSWGAAIRKELRFMDQTAISLCKDNRLPIVVCHQRDLVAAARGEDVGTLVGA